MLVVKTPAYKWSCCCYPTAVLHLTPVFPQALSLVEDGSDGLSVRHRAIVHHAISVGHPWVSAIYDECKETGDVRGLMVRESEKGQGAGFGACVQAPQVLPAQARTVNAVTVSMRRVSLARLSRMFLFSNFLQGPLVLS